MAINFEKSLDQDQYLAATHKDGPLLILAGAGSGKTRTLTHRVAWLIDQGVSPSSILLLTFTNKAADEMRDRARSLLDNRCDEITACTYHSFCVGILRRYGKRMGIPSDFSILSSTDAMDAVALVRSENKETYGMRGFPQPKTIVSMISMAVNTGRTLRGIIEGWQGGKYAKYSEEICDIARDYVRYKREHAFLDYDDLLVDTIRLVEQDEPARQRISDTYAYIMVDEYQDTNRLQEKLLMDLRRDNQNLVVVGDDYQSIYAFRGADINNILDFPKRFECDDIVRIRTNYRSTREICDLANAVMSTHAKFGYPKQMRSSRWGDTQPIVVRPHDDDEEAHWVVDEAKRLHDDEGIAWKDICVLTRASQATFMLENLLATQGISYEKLGGLKFLEYRCVLDLIAIIRVIPRPDDELSWFRVLKLVYGIGDRYARLIMEHGQEAYDDEMRGEDDPYSFIVDSKWVRRKFGNQLRELHDDLQVLRGLDWEAQVPTAIAMYMKMRRRYIEVGKYNDEADRTEDAERLEEDSSTLSALADMALTYASAGEFLDAIVLDSLPKTPTQARLMAARADMGNEPEGRNDGEDHGGGAPVPETDMLMISTIHSVKGLEFSAVIVLDCVDGVFPRETDDVATDMEELRCFYVAITRAKDWLYVCAPLLARKWGGIERASLTHFLDGIDEELYELRWLHEADERTYRPRHGWGWDDGSGYRNDDGWPGLRF